MTIRNSWFVSLSVCFSVFPSTVYPVRASGFSDVSGNNQTAFIFSNNSPSKGCRQTCQGKKVTVKKIEGTKDKIKKEEIKEEKWCSCSNNNNNNNNNNKKSKLTKQKRSCCCCRQNKNKTNKNYADMVLLLLSSRTEGDAKAGQLVCELYRATSVAVSPCPWNL